MPSTEKQGHRQRLRERFLKEEDSSRSEEALLELLLAYAIPRRDVQLLAKQLIDEFGSLSKLLEAPVEKLYKVKGIRENSVALIKLVDWIRAHHGAKQHDMRTSKPTTQTPLFEESNSEKSEPIESVKDKPLRQKVSLRRGTGMFGKAMLKEAIHILPNLPDTESLDKIRSFLRENLHFNAEQTRQRNASYIVRRMFPDGYADAPLRFLAKALPNTQELKDVCFYRFLQSEPLQVEIIENLILPSLSIGRLSRERIRSYLADKFPESQSIVDCSQAIVDALTAGRIVNADRKKIGFTYRKIPIASFAFALYSEFPEPGIYDIKKIEQNRMIKAMLWNPDGLLHALYELRNHGFISKISEIDNVRQFTTKDTLSGVVDRIISGGNKK